MGIYFDRDHALGIIFLFRVLVDFAAHRLDWRRFMRRDLLPPPRVILRNRSREQDAAWVCGAHRGYDACYFVGSVFVHAPDMPPELLIAVFPFDRFA